MGILSRLFTYRNQKYYQKKKYYQDFYLFLKTCTSALAHPPSVLFTLSFAQGHLPYAGKSANITTLHKKGAKTDPCNYIPINLSATISKVMESIIASDIKSSSSPMAWFPIINLDSDQVTLHWICCFCSPNNWWRSSMPDMKSEPYPWTYHVLLTRSGTLPCSPNSLPMVSKAISTHGSQTSSPITANVWL